MCDKCEWYDKDWCIERECELKVGTEGNWYHIDNNDTLNRCHPCKHYSLKPNKHYLVSHDARTHQITMKQKELV